MTILKADGIGFIVWRLRIIFLGAPEILMENQTAVMEWILSACMEILITHGQMNFSLELTMPEDLQFVNFLYEKKNRNTWDSK